MPSDQDRKADSTDLVTVGSVWRGFSGNLVVIEEVNGETCRWTYLIDPDDGSTDAVSEFAAAMEFVRVAGQENDGKNA